MENKKYQTRTNTKCFALMIDPKDSASNHRHQQHETALLNNIISSANLSDHEMEQLKNKLNELQNELNKMKQQNHRAINKNVQLMNENELLRDELNKVKSRTSTPNTKRKGYTDSTLPLFLASSQYSQPSTTAPFTNRQSICGTEAEFEMVDECEEEEMESRQSHHWRGRSKWKLLWLQFQSVRY